MRARAIPSDRDFAAAIRLTEALRRSENSIEVVDGGAIINNTFVATTKFYEHATLFAAYDGDLAATVAALTETK